MARPRGNDWLDDEVRKLKLQNVSLLVSLLESDEEFELELYAENEICNQIGIDFINYPIVDRSIPKNTESFLELVDLITHHLNKDNKVVIHCRMGIGRSSLLASAVMIKCGIDETNVFKLISKYRTIEVPDTKEQIKYIQELKTTQKLKA